jgi:carboxylesterase type B
MRVLETDSPQAKPPVGQLRWAPPEEYNGTGSIDATEFVSMPKTASSSVASSLHSDRDIAVQQTPLSHLEKS